MLNVDRVDSVSEVKRPKVGEEVPSEVRAEVRWSLTGVLSLDPETFNSTYLSVLT